MFNLFSGSERIQQQRTKTKLPSAAMYFTAIYLWRVEHKEHPEYKPDHSRYTDQSINLLANEIIDQ